MTYDRSYKNSPKVLRAAPHNYMIAFWHLAIGLLLQEFAPSCDHVPELGINFWFFTKA